MSRSKHLAVSGLTVRYGQTAALKDVGLTVAPGELVSVLGPSGCGKSTLLRAIAGLEPAAAGDIFIDGRSISGARPKARQIAFVFQSYALYPHMSCRQNIAMPLMMAELRMWGRLPVVGRAVPRSRRIWASIDARVDETARQLEITDLLDRVPGALSGGQRQRVALGRAIVREPSLFLLDEPLANLDAALRHQTRSELRALQQRLGTTTLFVTHDQGEAMAISDRVVVMFDGKVHQIGTPDELYRTPASLRIARFLSQPYLNVVDAGLLNRAIGERTRTGPIVVGGQALDTIDGVVAFRPEHAHLSPLQAPSLPGLKVAVEAAEHGGGDANMFVRGDADGARYVVRLPSQDLPRWPNGTRATLHFALEAAYVFPGERASRPDALRAVA